MLSHARAKYRSPQVDIDNVEVSYDAKSGSDKNIKSISYAIMIKNLSEICLKSLYLWR